MRTLPLLAAMFFIPAIALAQKVDFPKPEFPKGPPPVTGRASDELKSLDELMSKFIAENRIPGA